MDAATLQKLIEEMLGKMGIPFDSVEDLSDAGGFKFNVKTKSSGILIGARGEHISALNHLVKKIAAKKDEDIHVSVDVNGYLEEENRALRSKVMILAERAKSFKTSVELDPMSPYERMIVHSFLAEDPHIETKSVGEGKNRRVVIKYKEDTGE